MRVPEFAGRRLLRRPRRADRARRSSPARSPARSTSGEQAGARLPTDLLVQRLRDAELPARPRQLRAPARGRAPSSPARLLAGCPRVAMLATSREPLGVPGEVDYPVPPLAAAARRRDAGGAPLLGGRPALPGAGEGRPARACRTTTEALATAGPHLPRPRRAAARDRARRRAREGALARGDRDPPRRPLPLPRLVAPADVRPATGRCARRWTGATSCSRTEERDAARAAVRLRRRLHARRGRDASAWTATTRVAVDLDRPAGRRFARRRRGARRRDALPPARDGPAVRRRAARRGRRGRGGASAGTRSGASSSRRRAEPELSGERQADVVRRPRGGARQPARGARLARPRRASRTCGCG